MSSGNSPLNDTCAKASLLSLLGKRDVFVGYMFGIDDFRVCRIIQRLETILASVMASSKRKKLLKEEVETLIIDATEQPVERPQRKVEHIFGNIKTFKIMSDHYRNKRKRYAVKFNIIAGIVNLKNGFGAA